MSQKRLPLQAGAYDLRRLLFEYFYSDMFQDYSDKEGVCLNTLRQSLSTQMEGQIRACKHIGHGQQQSHRCDCSEIAQTVTTDLVNTLPEIKDMLMLDVQAAFDGDPAAQSTQEVILAYPCIEAITVHRVAHFLYQNNIPLLPRILSEQAHRKSGIDIHPGAHLGSSFFIDHGTGVVIGETTTVGNFVKVYQGVTLGALSIPKDERGRAVRGLKRHPTIEDNVVIYAGATILGGETVIGHHAIIGGNTWITHSIPPYSKVTTSPGQRIIHRESNDAISHVTGV